MTRPLAWMSWSSGKDSALALHEAKESGDVEIVGLVTTLNVDVQRVAMHAVRRELLDAQARSLGLPLHVVEIPANCSNEVYEAAMRTATNAAVDLGVRTLVFGDLFLEDVRAYRERALGADGIDAHFPLWRRPTQQVAAAILEAGIKAVVTCVDPSQAPRWLAGRWFDETFLHELPERVDPCGENGEFHTFVCDGPDFAYPIGVVVGELVERDGFVFADVLAT